MPKKIHSIVNGVSKPSMSGRFHEVFNPATGEQTGQVDLCSAAEVSAAVAAAKAALPEWAATPPMKRIRCLFNFKVLLESNAQRIAHLLSEEHGKTLDDAMGELSRGIEVVDFCCGIPHLLKGEFSRDVGTGVDTYSDRQPLGVVAGITPFNFPVMVPMWMYPVAVACGNTFVLKPSERDPSAGLLVQELIAEAGFPAGVINMVMGDKEAVDTLLTHADVKAVSFVGSTPIAEYVYRTGTANGKRIQALGGAKNHMVIMPDADMEQVADALMGAVYGSAGERCMAISVAVPVGEETADRLIDIMRPRIEALRVGPATETNSQMGPLITRASLDRVSGYLDKGVADGATLVVDGRKQRQTAWSNGYFIAGSLFDHATTEMSIYKDEIFGPVLVVVRTDSFAAALEMVNVHEYGNGAAIFTRDGDCARTFANAVQAGMVGVNVPIPVPVSSHSFGGWKRSLFGDHAIYGPEGVHFYTRLKTVTTRWPAGIRSGVQFDFPTLE